MSQRPIEQRLDDIEGAISDLATLIRHMGQELSWSSAGQSLNRPPQWIKDAQKRIAQLHNTVNEERLERQRDADARARAFERIALTPPEDLSSVKGNA